MRRGRHVHGAERPGASNKDVLGIARDLDAGGAHLDDERLHVRQLRASQRDLAPFRERGGDHVRPRLDAVGDDRVIEGSELSALGSSHVNHVGPGAVDLRPHLVEDAPELFDLRLARAVDERRAALCQGGGHHEVLGSRDRRDVEVDLTGAQPAADPRCLDMHVAALEPDPAAHRFEALEVLVDGPRTDGASPRQRDLCVAESRHERAKYEDARAHLLDELVRRFGPNARARGDLDHRRGNLHVATEKPQQGRGRIDVAETRDVAQPTGAVREERRAQDGKRSVLGSADLNGAAKRPARADPDGVHAPRFLPEFSATAKWRASPRPGCLGARRA